MIKSLNTQINQLILLIIMIILFVSCHNNNDDENQNTNSNLNQINSENTINSNNSENQNNDDSNINRKNNNIINNQPTNITNNTNIDNNSNISNLNQTNINQNTNDNVSDNSFSEITDPEHCIMPSDYNGENAPRWLREQGYLTRPLCRLNKISMIRSEGSSILLNENLCSSTEGCVMPTLETSSISSSTSAILLSGWLNLEPSR